ncbi:FAD-dependent oxidoreductase [Gordonia polyisoprenivorans]|uniref:FAD-dependent oxidoreductase n=1 Tax=Gordonia polyisoprenivorans TaxID=84595 RepID=UPI001AD6A4CC|nr:FAD-dependent monooxygenase [Gordonia polyisoprenivorans]QTI69919.1 FAD-dependent monooxygenase [Gordonia polyisoprenivorans]
MNAHEVIVVGGGPVGLIHALGLARAGVGVTVLEAENQAGTTPGDLVYHWNVLPWLDGLGILDDLLRAGNSEPHQFYRVGSTGETLTLDLGVLADESPFPFNLHVRQHEVTRILLEHLGEFRDVTILLSSALTDLAQDDAGVTVTFDGPSGEVTLRAGWVVGADGSRSAVRRRLGLPFTGITWPERLISVEIDANLEMLGMHGAGYVIDPRFGAIVACIDPGSRWRYIYAEDRLLPEDTIGERLPRVLSHALSPEVADASFDWANYRIHQRAAATFRVGRVMIIGDAAHLTNPASGHGMSGGLFDSFALTEVLAAVVSDKSDESLLDRWAEERRQNFVEYSSPTSSERKKFVYNLEDDAAVEQEFAPMRRIAADPDRMREWFALARMLEPPRFT